MLTLDDITLRQGTFELHADLTLPRGTIAALIGPSGGGKSTALSAIAGFFAPASGRIIADGRDITQDAPADRPISILFQDNNLFPHLTVSQNVGLGLRPDLRLSTSQQAQVAHVLAQVGLADLGMRKPAALSGGQQSRAALARALLRDRPLLLLDEPFSALGPALRHDMLDLVAATARGAGLTVLMVTHDPEDARRIADMTCVIAQGRILPPAPTGPLFADPPPALKAYLG
jgi:thiamine transport system ATP-binding protein